MSFKIGTKQTTKMVEQRKAALVYVAQDADPQITNRIVQQCTKTGIEIAWIDTMAHLGEKCGIDIGSAMAAWVPDEE